MNYDREHELYLHMKELEDELLNDQKELQYFGDFLSWMNLWDDFIYFRENAHLMQDPDEPFPRYVL
jgi:hypothetical protein